MKYKRLSALVLAIVFICYSFSAFAVKDGETKTYLTKIRAEDCLIDDSFPFVIGIWTTWQEVHATYSSKYMRYIPDWTEISFVLLNNSARELSPPVDIDYLHYYWYAYSYGVQVDWGWDIIKPFPHGTVVERICYAYSSSEITSIKVVIDTVMVNGKKHTLTGQHEVLPTCAEPGITQGIYCSDCGEIFSGMKEIPALPHTLVVDKGWPATYTETGMTDGSHCSVCGQTIVEQEIIPKLVRPDVTGVNIKETTITIDLGKPYTIEYELLPKDAESKVKWTSSAPTVAMVENGVVTGLKEGKATITATTLKNNFTDTVSVTVIDSTKPTGIKLVDEETVIIDLGETRELKYKLLPNTAESSVIWSSSAATNVGVNNGIVTGLKEGTAVITVKPSKNTNLKDTITIKVVDSKKPTGIQLEDEGVVVIDLGEERELGYKLLPDIAESDVTWSSSGTTTVSVAGGIVKGLKEGIATITVKTKKNGLTDTVKVQVVDSTKPTGIELKDEGTVEVNLNQPYTLEYTLLPDTAVTELTWTSSDSKIATVKDGIVTGVKEGTATITVKTVKNNKTDIVKVKVIYDPRLPGDVNDDGTVNGKDGLRLLQYLSGWSVNINASNSDVNGDGTVSGKDGVRLLQYLSGWDVVLK